ncbi:MAG: hypothetical protein FWE40_04435 [Oscillospiraceae bacterium]|nr:hypothetical protein [Oscillospiraceae bacterium]
MNNVTIRELEEKEIETMEYKYHCQHAAELIANSMLPVPEDYPLANGLPDDFIEHFTQLRNLIKDIYLDMAKQPEAYGLVLTDYNLQSADKKSKEYALAMKSKNSVNRLPDTLFRLSQNGEVHNHQLIVSLPSFKESLKQTATYGLSAVTKYELILSRLVDFGFSISGFNGKPFAKTVDSFTVEYPDTPELIDTLKTFCDLWHENKIRQQQEAPALVASRVKPALHYGGHMNFDFRFTADQDKILMCEWIRCELQSQGYSEDRICFYTAFYDYSIKYTDMQYNGDYYVNAKRIVHLGYKCLRLILKNPNNYMDEITTMPEVIRDVFANMHCRFCNFQGATKEHCKFQFHWTYNDAPRAGCAHTCFIFPDNDATLVPYYWRLLELEYDINMEDQV